MLCFEHILLYDLPSKFYKAKVEPIGHKVFTTLTILHNLFINSQIVSGLHKIVSYYFWIHHPSQRHLPLKSVLDSHTLSDLKGFVALLNNPSPIIVSGSPTSYPLYSVSQ